MDPRRVLAPLLALALLAACSRVQVGWRLAPWMLEREGARWLGLRGGERDAFGRDARAWLGHGAAHAVPPLARLCRGLDLDLRHGHDVQVLDTLFKQAPEHWDRLLEPALPPLARWLAREPGQRADALQRAFERRHAESRERRADPAAAAERREQRLRKNLREWVGPLTPGQEEELRAWVRRSDFPWEAWQADRVRREQALLQALRRGDGAEALQARLQAWWVRPEAERDLAYQRELTAYRESARLAAGRLLAGLSPEQRRRLGERLRTLAQDLEAIAAQAQAGESAAP